MKGGNGEDDEENRERKGRGKGFGSKYPVSMGGIGRLRCRFRYQASKVGANERLPRGFLVSAIVTTHEEWWFNNQRLTSRC